MDYQELKLLEDDLWEAADQLRANSKLTASEYSMPVLGLIFLRHATTRFNELLPAIEAAVPSRAKGSLRQQQIRLGFQGKAAIYLPETSRYDYLAALPAGINVGNAIRAAMMAIEASVVDSNGNHPLEGALPKDYIGMEPDLLAELIKIFNRPALQTAKGDVFGRIYEYFLNQFAQSGAQEGGEFFTPPSLVRMIVNVIEPDHGIVLDPACGSAGMFVQTGHFIEEQRKKSASDINIRFYGQEKADLNSKLARMNLAVHGLEGNIRIGNTFYEDHHQMLGACDFVMANPPFNVDGVQVAKIKSQVGEKQTGRLPFGLPGVAGKTKRKNNGDGESISNANSLWIQYFYSYLNRQGRAGFVMSSAASDAGNKDKDIRQQLVETGHVDVMMSIGPKFFYTRSLPCTLWFFDKGKPADRRDTVLMIDARNVYTVVSARSHVFTDEQLANLSAITWLYRNEQSKFVTLLGSYQDKAADHLALLPDRIASDDQQIALLSKTLRNFGKTTQDAAALAAVREKLGEEHGLTDEVLENYRAELHKVEQQTQDWRTALDAALGSAKKLLIDGDDPSPLGRGAGVRDSQSKRDSSRRVPHPALSRRPLPEGEVSKRSDSAASGFEPRKALQTKIETINPILKAGLSALEARHKAWLKLLELAEKTLRARQWAAFEGDAIRDARKSLLPRDPKRREQPTVRDQGVEAFKRASYFIAQGHWLLSRFPQGRYADVPGLCKAVTRQDIANNDYSLTPGRYVGVALGSQGDDDGEAFAGRMREIHSELSELNDQAARLAVQIQTSIAEFLP